MWEMLIHMAIGLSGWVFAGWIMYCRWRDWRTILAGLEDIRESLDRMKDNNGKNEEWLLGEIEKIRESISPIK